MAIKTLKLIIFFVFISNLSASDVFERFLQDVSQCKEVCKNTYSPHTYEKSHNIECCERGCRLFSVIESVNHCINTTNEDCPKSCEEAYSKTEEQDACKMGCKSQKPFALEQEEDTEEFGPSIHLMYPLMYIHRMYSDMISNVISRSSVSWSVYMRDDDGSVMVVKSAPKLEFMNINGDIDNFFDDDYKTASYLETNIEPMDNSATPIGKHSQLRARPKDDDTIDLAARDLNSDRSRSDAEASDWLSCVSRKTGLPRLLLSWLLLMCAVVMIWLCLSAAVTSPDHKIVTEPQKLSINGDQEVIAELLAQGIKPSYPQGSGDEYTFPIKLKVQRI